MGAGSTRDATARGYRSPRREAQARDTRARITAAAARRFLAHGYAGTTMRAVALDAGVALPTVELAFRTKARLLKAVIDIAIAGDDQHAAMLERGWAARAESIAGPAGFVAAFARVLTTSAERAAGLAATALEAARVDDDIAAVAAQLMAQRQVMAAWLVDGIMLRSPLRDEASRADAVDTVWTLMDPVVFRRLTEDRRWPPGRFERWFTDSVTQLLLPAGSESSPPTLIGPAQAPRRPRSRLAAPDGSWQMPNPQVRQMRLERRCAGGLILFVSVRFSQASSLAGPTQLVSNEASNWCHYSRT